MSLATVNRVAPSSLAFFELVWSTSNVIVAPQNLCTDREGDVMIAQWEASV